MILKSESEKVHTFCSKWNVFIPCIFCETYLNIFDSIYCESYGMQGTVDLIHIQSYGGGNNPAELTKSNSVVVSLERAAT